MKQNSIPMQTEHNPDFESKFLSYMEGCKRIHRQYVGKHYSATEPDHFRFEVLQKRIRVIHGSSVHSFVDIQSGDVLKPAGWKVPAKHARGNIFDADNGLKFMGPFGPAYLK